MPTTDETTLPTKRNTSITWLHDHTQIEFGERWPVYGFERHKGYGTRAHRDAIREHGMVEIHRRSFLKKMEASGGKISENKG